MNCFGGCNSWIIILILICLFCDNGVGFANNGCCGNNCGCATPCGGGGCGCGCEYLPLPPGGQQPRPYKKPGAPLFFLRRPRAFRLKARTGLQNNH